VTSGPSPQGVAELRQAAAALGRPPRPPAKRRRIPTLTKRRVALFVVVDLVVGGYAWHYVTEPHPGAAAAAVERVAADAGHNNWAAVYANLCSSDHGQIAESDLAGAGKAALYQLGGLSHATVTTVTPTSVPIGPLHWPAAQVAGQLVPPLGTPSAYTVTVVHEVTGWKLCLSAGGYSSARLGVSVPLGQTAF
jgi:hypothetical protein